MNIFRILGDVLHVASIILLLLKIRKTRSCAGISLKTQELYALVFVTRYLDLFDIHLNFLSFYNFFLKLVFLATSIYTVYLIRFRYRNTYDAKHDSFRIIFLIVPCAFLSLMLNEAFTIMEVHPIFFSFLFR
jgi:ER lumen protein retaining receptor